MAKNVVGGQSTRGPASSRALYVGRVGALAVALGVGVLVSGNGATAWATGDGSGDGNNSAGATGNSGAGSEGSTGTAGDTAPAKTAASGDPRSPHVRLPGSHLVQAIVHGSGGLLNGTHRPGTHQPKSSVSASNPDTDPSAPTNHDPVFNLKRSRPSPPPTSTVAPNTPAPRRLPEHHTLPQVDAQLTRGVQHSVTDDIRDTIDTSVMKIVPPSAGLHPSTAAAPTVAVDAVTGAAPIVRTAGAPAHPVARLVGGLLAALGVSPNATHGPVPVGPLGRVLLGALETIRREIEHTLNNQAPQFASDTTSLTATGTTPVTVPGATDADGDEITYSAPARGATGGPAHGTVTTTNGTVAYTPDAGYTGTDHFTLTASDADAGFHLHGLTSLLNPTAAHIDTESVTVNVQAAQTDPPTVPDPQHPYTPDPLVHPGDPAGTVRGTINATDPQGAPITYRYTGPTTTTDGSTIAVNPNGAFVYTPSDAARHAAAAADAAQSGADTFTFHVTATNTAGATDIVVTVPVEPRNQVPTAPTTPPATTVSPSDGSVSSTVGYTDPDNDTLTYTGPAGGHTAGGGTVTLDPATGKYTYTPDPADRLNAYTHPEQNTDTFTVTVSDGYGSTQTIAVPVTIDPTEILTTTHDTSVPGIPASGVPSGPGSPDQYALREGANGTSARTSYTDSEADGTSTTTVTVIHPDGSTTSVDSIHGRPAGGAAVGADGTVAQTTYDYTEADGQTTTVTVIHPDGTITTTDPVPGTPTRQSGPPGTRTVSATVGDDGTVAQTITTGSYQDGYQSVLTVIHPDGTVTTSSPVTGEWSNSAVVAADGTAAQNFRVYNGVDGYNAVVTVIHPDGTVTTTDTAVGTPGPIMAGDDGTVAYVRSTNTDGVGYQSAVTVVHPDGTVTTTDLVRGSVTGLAVTDDGTTYEAHDFDGTTTDGYESHTVITIVQPDGTTTTTTDPIPGSGFNGMVLGPDGTAYETLAAYQADGYHTVVMTIHPDGTVTATDPIDGTPNYGVVVGADGTAAQTMTTSPPGGGQESTSLLVVHPDGTVTTTDPVPGYRGYDAVAVGADGTVAQTTSLYDDDTDLVHSVITVVHPDGTVTITEPIPGSPPYAGTAVVTQDGTVAQTATVYNDDGTFQTFQTRVTLIHPDGTVTTTDPYGGFPYSGLVASEDGTTYQATYTRDADGQFHTVVHAVRTDGSVVTTDAIPGLPSGDVVTAPNGAVYIVTQTGGGTTPGPYVMHTTIIRVAESPATTV